MISDDEQDLTHSLGSQLGRLARLARKEISEILRDRRTIITLVLMPLLLYPVMTVAFQQFFVTHVSTETVWALKIGFRTAAEREWIEGHLRAGQRLLSNAASGPEGTAVQYDLRCVVAENLEEDVRQGI